MVNSEYRLGIKFINYKKLSVPSVPTLRYLCGKIGLDRRKSSNAKRFNHRGTGGKAQRYTE